MKRFMKRLRFWLFQRGKQCKSCCLFCGYYDICKLDFMDDDFIEVDIATAFGNLSEAAAKVGEAAARAGAAFNELAQAYKELAAEENDKSDGN